MKSLKEHFSYLFEQQKKQQILFTLKDPKINTAEDALSILLAFDVLHAFLNNESKTMLQKAYGGNKIAGNSNTNINVGKAIDFKKLENPSGLNLNNPSAVANAEKDEVNSVSNIRKFVQLTKDAVNYLQGDDIKSMTLESENKIKINRMHFNIETNKLLGGKLKALVDEDNEKINITKLIDYFRKNIDKFFKNPEEIKND